MFSEKLIARFWACVDVRGENECWPWIKHADKDGYGRLRTGDGKRMPAHRFACTLAHGESDLSALHSCHYEPCCNPGHLRWGTPLENTQDMIEAGRMSHGDAHPISKLSSEQVFEARRRFSDGEAKRALAREFHISQTQMRRVLGGASWRHV